MSFRDQCRIKFVEITHQIKILFKQVYICVKSLCRMYVCIAIRTVISCKKQCFISGP